MKFQINPVGVLWNREDSTVAEIYPEYSDAIMGLEQFSHIMIFCWFHKNDRDEQREILQVHPRKDRNKPLRGVFATRSPQRPNPIGIFICSLVRINGNMLKVKKIDAFDGTPIIDIKPYIPGMDSIKNGEVPDWVK